MHGPLPLCARPILYATKRDTSIKLSVGVSKVSLIDAANHEKPGTFGQAAVWRLCDGEARNVPGEKEM